MYSVNQRVIDKVKKEMNEALEYLNSDEKVKEIVRIWKYYISNTKERLDPAAEALTSLEKDIETQTKGIRGKDLQSRLREDKELRKALEITDEFKEWSKWDELHKALIALRRDYLADEINELKYKL